MKMFAEKELVFYRMEGNTRFDYQTVAAQASYMSDNLKVYANPTHFLVDKAGKVIKVANSADEVETFLKRIL